MKYVLLEILEEIKRQTELNSQFKYILLTTLVIGFSVIFFSVWSVSTWVASKVTGPSAPEVVEVTIVVSDSEGDSVSEGVVELFDTERNSAVAASDITDGKCIPRMYLNNTFLDGIPLGSYRLVVSIFNVGTWEIEQGITVIEGDQVFPITIPKEGLASGPYENTLN